jgi:general secretion pathway protein B
MSFILDALKKSEIERQRQTMPGLIESGMAPARPRVAVWAIALGAALLGINLAVLLVVVLRSGNPAAPAPSALRPPAKRQLDGAPAANAASAGSTAAAARNAAPLADPAATADAARRADAVPAGSSAAAPEHFSPMGPPVYAPEIPVAADDGTAAPQSPIGRPVTSPAAARALHRPDPSMTDEGNKSDNDEVLPSISEVNLTGPSALPELHLDVHVFATRPSERFVYINMRKYHEGDTLEEGPTIERIRRDGVVLSFHGLRFILPRAVGQSGGPSQ